MAEVGLSRRHWQLLMELGAWVEHGSGSGAACTPNGCIFVERLVLTMS